MNLPHFFIVTPPFMENSDGVKTLHYLCHNLNKNGLNASLVLLNPKDIKFQSFLAISDKACFCESLETPFTGALKDINLEKDIVIYPEIIQGNPIGAKNVVRYFLNKSGFITGSKIIESKSDFILSYQKIFYPNANFNLYISMVDILALPTRNAISKLNKNISCTFIGKGKKYGATMRIPGSICLDWNKSYEEYTIMLDNTKFLFTWDPMSGVMFDAITRGCIPVLLTLKPWTIEEFTGQEVFKPYMTVEEFDCKSKYFNNYDLFLDDRDKMINDFSVLQANSIANTGIFAEKAMNFFRIK